MPRTRNLGKHGRPTYDQARKIIARFGGEAKLAKLIGVNRSTLYRWQHRRPYGSDGLVPTEHIEKIKGVARLEGVLIRPEDWVPNVLKYEDNPACEVQSRDSILQAPHPQPQQPAANLVVSPATEEATSE